jgi:K+ transport systems, NAD-binding component
MKTFVVIGLGRFGRAVSKKLFELGHEVLVIDKDEAVVQKFSRFVTHAVTANAKDMDVLKELGVRNYDCVILTAAQGIEESVLITFALKELGVKRLICKARDDEHKKILEKIGADKVIIPEYETGIKMAIKLGSKNLLEFVELSDGYGLSEIEVPTPWVGHALVDLDIRRKYNVNIVTIKSKKCKELETVIDPKYVFGEDDTLVIIGKNEYISAVSLL